MKVKGYPTTIIFWNTCSGSPLNIDNIICHYIDNRFLPWQKLVFIEDGKKPIEYWYI